MDQRGAAEARVLHVEREIAAMDRDLRALRVRAIALGQGIWQEWSDVEVVSTENTATFTGTLTGCGGAGVSGVVITLSTGGTVTSGAGGAFSGSVTFSGSTVSETFTTTLTSQYQASTHTFTLVPGANALGNLAMVPIVTSAPTISTISNVVVCGGSGGTVSLSGITDGNSGADLPIAVSATSSNTSIIPNPTVTYTSPNTTGTLNYTITGTPSATATITVKVVNAGSTFCSGVTTKTTTFTIQVKQPSTPTLNPISNPGVVLAGSGNQTVTLAGITAGAGNPPGSLSVTATSATPSVAGIVSVAYTNPNTLGSVTYSIGTPGSAVITVTVTDGNVSRCGSTNFISHTFTVTVS